MVAQPPWETRGSGEECVSPWAAEVEEMRELRE